MRIQAAASEAPVSIARQASSTMNASNPARASPAEQATQVSPRVPVLPEHREALRERIDDRHDRVATGNGQAPSRQEVVLHVGDEQDVVIGQWHRRLWPPRRSKRHGHFVGRGWLRVVSTGHVTSPCACHPGRHADPEDAAANFKIGLAIG
jgi:hypothetical protein